MTEPDDIRSWQRLSPQITTSGRITLDDVGRLEALGVRHVINLALAEHPEALPDADAVMDANSLGYSHIPVPFDAPSEAHFQAFCAAMAAAPRPIHVHCIMNWRVSAFFYRYHRDVLGMDEAAARALMAQQWEPETDPNPDAPAWARFIA